MKVLLTGSAGFIGSAIDRALTARGDEVVRVDLMLPDAHGAAEAPDGTHRLDVRDADRRGPTCSRGVDAVCHQAALVGLGVRVADLPSYASHNDLGTAALLAAMHEAGVARLVLASSMVVYGEGRYACPGTEPQLPGPRSEADLEAGRFENPCPRLRRAARLGPRRRGRPARPAQRLRRQQAGAGALRRGLGTPGRRLGGRPALPQRLRPGHAPGHAVLRGRGDVPVRRSSAASAPRVFEDGGQMRDFVHVDDVARANVLALDAVAAAPTGGSRRTTSARAARSRSSTSPALVAGSTGPRPTVTGEYRLGDVRHIVASPERARTELGFKAEIGPDEGLARFATDPLRA